MVEGRKAEYLASIMRLKDPYTPLYEKIQTLTNPVLVRGPAVRSWSIDAAVFDRNGVPVEAATCLHTSTNSAFKGVPEPGATPQHLAGRWLYGGISYEHFGHTLTESLSRLWALDFVGPVDGILFFPLLPDDPGNVLKDALALLNIRLLCQYVTGDVTVDELLLPPQGMGTGDLMGGSPEFRAFVKHGMRSKPKPGLPERLYISRSCTRAERGSFLGERRLERLLEKEGYAVFHPQHHSLADQFDHYATARYIVGPDGSPFHLVAFAGNERQRAAILKRRPGREWALLADHLSVFGVGHVVTVEGQGGWSPGGIRRAGLSVTGEISFSLIHATLLQGGFINSPTPWPDLSDTERTEDLRQIAETLDADLYEVKGPGQSLSHLPRRSAEGRYNLLSLGQYPAD